MAMAEQAAPRNIISTASGVRLNLLAWILIEGLVGWSAGMVVRQPAFGCISYILVGIFGTIIGGVILSALRPGV